MSQNKVGSLHRCAAVKVEHYENNPWSGVLVDFLYYDLLFCEERGFSAEKTSAFFSIMKAVFDFTFKYVQEDEETVGGVVDPVSLEQSYAFFRAKARHIYSRRIGERERVRTGSLSLSLKTRW